MNKKEIVIKVSKKLDKSQKDVNQIIDCFLDEISHCLYHDEKVLLTRFGMFEKVQTKPYNIFNPQDGSIIKCQKQYRIRFRSSDKLKELINKKQD